MILFDLKASLPMTSLLTMIVVASTHSQATNSRQPSDTGEQQVQKVNPAAGPPYSTYLAIKLQRLSCFDTPIGEKMGGIVPIGIVTDTEKVGLQKAWQRVLSPNVNPLGDAAVEWREILWSLVEWQKPGRNTKAPGAPGTNVTAAQWFVAGSPYIVKGATVPNGVGGITVTISLTGEDRLRFRWPQIGEHDPQGPMWQIVTQVDKDRLLAILTTAFRLPWKTIDDFVVTWNPSPFEPGAHFQIESTPRKGDALPQHWYDVVPFQIDGGDPQRISLSFRLSRSSDDE